MENENLIPEEETNILTLTDENGQDVEFEYLDCIEYGGKEYLVLMPASLAWATAGACLPLAVRIRGAFMLQARQPPERPSGKFWA